MPEAHPQGCGTTGTLTPDRPVGPHYFIDVLGILGTDHQGWQELLKWTTKVKVRGGLSSPTKSPPYFFSPDMVQKHPQAPGAGKGLPHPFPNPDRLHRTCGSSRFSSSLRTFTRLLLILLQFCFHWSYFKLKWNYIKPHLKDKNHRIYKFLNITFPTQLWR